MVFIWRKNMLGYLSARGPRSEQFSDSVTQGKLWVSRIMPKVKYPSIFLRQMEAIGFIILQIFFATRAVLKLGNVLRNIRSRDAFRPIVRARKYLMDYKYLYATLCWYCSLILQTIVSSFYSGWLGPYVNNALLLSCYLAFFWTLRCSILIFFTAVGQ